MKLTFRWYGNEDTATLQHIRQIPTVTNVAWSIHDVPIGDIWSNESIEALKTEINSNGMSFEVLESLPVAEDIKLGNKNASLLIDNYCENIRRLGKAGIKCIAYNFTPIFDWWRSDLKLHLTDGSTARAYNQDVIFNMNPLKNSGNLPIGNDIHTKKELKNLFSAYTELSEEGLWRNLATFLKAVIPVAEECGVKMAIYPDDPPWGIFGLPRIITCEKNIDRLLKIVDSPSNCITFCTGSLGADPKNDLIKMATKYCYRIPLLHLRNIKITGDRKFEEVAHPTECGSIDMYGIVKALVQKDWDGYVSPDHGRAIWGDEIVMGYGLFDRALGATYIAGLFEAVEKDLIIR